MVCRPHVLQVFQPEIGGVPAYVANLAGGLRELGWRVSVAAPAQHSAAAQLEHVAERQLVIESGSGWSPKADARALRALLDFTRRERVDLLHGHSSKASVLVGLAARRAGRVSVYTPHTWAFQRSSNPLAGAPYAAIEAVLARRCHRRIVAVSESEATAASLWHVVGRNAVQVVRSGLPVAPASPSRADARRRLALDPELPVVAWVGRLHRAKRPQELAPLAARLRGKARLVALGQSLPGSPEGAALQRAGGRVLEGADPSLLLGAADLLVLTSAWEAMPLCVLEAMRASLPVVAYDVGDLHAQVVDGGSGFLVRPFDVAEFARRTTLLVENPALRAALGAAGRRRLDAQFSYPAMVRSIDAAYREALGLAASAAPGRPRLTPTPADAVAVPSLTGQLDPGYSPAGAAEARA
jgi:glycosyltransferase involved in cell wall biosynthesis